MAASTKVKTQNQYVASLLDAIQSQRQLCQFTDITIECGQRGFVAHRVILHAASPYFRKLLDNEPSETPLEKVVLRGVECDAIDSVLKFIYTGSIDPFVDDDAHQLKSLLAAAHLLQVTVLYEYYWNEFIKRLTADCYVDVWNTAEVYASEQLLAVIPSYLAVHFQAASSTDDFLELSSRQLKQLLEQPETQNSISDCIVEACLKWIKHKPEERKHELASLFSFIDSNDLSNQFLGNVLHTEPLITECAELYDRLISVALNRLVHTGAQTSPHRSYFVCCGNLDNKSIISMYDFKAKVWLAAKVLALPLTTGTSVASYDGALYFIGGVESAGDAVDYVFKYYPLTNSVTSLSSLLIPTYHAGAGVLKDKLYLVGGIHRSKETSCVECYDPMSDEWMSVAPTVKAHSFTNVVALHDNLYVVGSYKCSMVERYNSTTNQWSEITSIPQPLGDGWPRATVHKQQFWVFRHLHEEKFHIYDPLTDRWEEKDFESGPDKVYGLWSSQYNQRKQFPLVVLNSSSCSYYLYHDETATWEALPPPETVTDSYYWQSLIFNN